MLNKDSIPLGFVLGIVIPFVGYAVWLMVFEQLTEAGVMSPQGFTTNWRERTIGLLAICCNLIPFLVYNKKRFTNTMRGIIFPTVGLAMVWFYFFGAAMIN